MNPRRVVRGLVARSLPGPIRPRQRIAVSGLPRSGTSWLGRALSLARSVSYYFEPDRPLPEGYRYRYLPAAEEDTYLERQVDRMLRGRVCDDWQVAEKSLGDLLLTPVRRTLLVKWVWLSLALDWVASRVTDLVVVQIIRHPVPQFLSWQQRGWTPARPLAYLLEQPALLEGPLRPYAAVLRRARSPWEQAGAFWGAVTRLQLDAHRPGWILREHEWFCTDPEARFRQVAESLDLGWTDALGEFLLPTRSRVEGPGYGARRNPRDEIHKWRGRVGAADLRELQDVVQEFHLPFYPELAPDRFWDPT